MASSSQLTIGKMIPINRLSAGLDQQLVALGEVLAAPPTSLVGTQRTWVSGLQHMVLFRIHLRNMKLESRTQMLSLVVTLAAFFWAYPPHSMKTTPLQLSEIHLITLNSGSMFSATNILTLITFIILKSKVYLVFSKSTESVSCSQPRALCEFASPLRTVNTCNVLSILLLL